MKINRIELHNITSFDGTQTIDFNQILGNSSLFAITGPTGSGKSSILNSITMALYGDVPKKITASDLVTTGKESGAITLDFEIDRVKYKIAWSAKVLKKDKTPLKNIITNREIYKNGVRVDTPIEDVVGLSYEEFSRAIFLGQGEFSRFLLGTFSERKTILEKVSKSFTLTRLVNFLKEKVNSFEQEKRDLEQQLLILDEISPEAIQMSQDELSSIQKSHDQLVREIPLINQIYRPINEFIKESERLSLAKAKELNLTMELAKLKITLNNLQEDLNKLNSSKNGLDKTFSELAPRFNDSKIISAELEGVLNLLNITRTEYQKLDQEIKSDLDIIKNGSLNTSDSIAKLKDEIGHLNDTFHHLKAELKYQSIHSSDSKEDNTRSSTTLEAINICHTLYIEEKKCPVCHSPFRLTAEESTSIMKEMEQLKELIKSKDLEILGHLKIEQVKEGLTVKRKKLEELKERGLHIQSKKDHLLGKKNSVQLSADEEIIFKNIQLNLEQLVNSIEKATLNFTQVSSNYNFLEGQLGLIRQNIKEIEFMRIDLNNKVTAINLSDEYIPTFIRSVVEKVRTNTTLIDVDINILKELVDQIAIHLENKEIKLKEILTQLGEKKSYHQNLLDQKNKIDLLSKRHIELSQIYSPYNELSLILGKQDEFKNYLLTRIEKILIDLTNKELSLLCAGRYRLTQVEKKLGADFYVIDNFQDSAKRKLATLSGGETFLISLAIALSLAEMVRGSVAIDSFFIDEGFGTLDSESIDEVLDVLNQLATRGKQIGIISHVKELTDRINLNIEVRRTGNGSSSVTSFAH